MGNVLIFHFQMFILNFGIIPYLNSQIILIAHSDSQFKLSEQSDQTVKQNIEKLGTNMQALKRSTSQTIDQTLHILKLLSLSWMIVETPQNFRDF